MNPTPSKPRSQEADEPYRLLSDLEILDRLVRTDDSCIFLTPLIDPVEQIGPASLDVRLGTELRVARNIAIATIDLTGEEDFQASKTLYYEARRVPADGSFVLHPGEFALASTLEYIRLPRDIAARLEGRSSMGRLGLIVHATAGFVDPGFEGALTFELANAGKVPVRLKPGLRLGQLCFIGVRDVQVGYMLKRSNKYGGKTGVEVTRAEEDVEVSPHHKPNAEH